VKQIKWRKKDWMVIVVLYAVNGPTKEKGEKGESEEAY
jgi:hypothetical protein